MRKYLKYLIPLSFLPFTRLQDASSARLKLLLISPERLSSRSFTSFLSSAPPLAFVCVDEAHCIAEMSHNFRPSFLLIRSYLAEATKGKLQFPFLALTVRLTLVFAPLLLRYRQQQPWPLRGPFALHYIFLLRTWSVSRPCGPTCICRRLLSCRLAIALLPSAVSSRSRSL